MSVAGHPGWPAGIAALEIGAKDVGVTPAVRDPVAVEGDGWVAAAVDVVACLVGVRRERLDAVVPVIATVCRDVKARRPPAEAVVIGAADGVPGIRRVDGDRGLVLREARVV